MGVHRLITDAHASRRWRALLGAAVLASVASVAACTSGGGVAAPAIPSALDPTAATATSDAAPSSAAATTVAPTTAATEPPSTTPPTTVAPTTTTAEPPPVACPADPRPLAEVQAASDADPVPPPERSVPLRPLGAGSLYVDPDGQAAEALAAEPPGRGHDVLERLATIPTSFPVGDWLGDRVTERVAALVDGAAAQGQLAVLQVYDLPHRDSGAGFSAGGARTADEYVAFTEAVAAGIRDRAVVIVLEPDALGQMASLTPPQQAERYGLLNRAVDRYAAMPRTLVYLDGTHCAWLPAELNAQRLLRAGVARAQGFFVNVANFQPTDAEVSRARTISRLTGGSHAVVDTGRNGNGPYLEPLRNPWCNPPGRALGAEPVLTTDRSVIDAYLWVKPPGASDGTCGRGNPVAGTWWTAQAVTLATNAGW